MKSPVQYSHDLDEVLKETPVSAAKLSKMEQSLQMDLRALRMQFQGREVSAIQQASKKSGSERSEQEKRLQEESISRTKAYQELLDRVRKEIAAH